MDTSFIACTSVVVESLFSQSRFYFDARRLGTSPEHIEQQMFLKANQELWSTATVNRIYRRVDAANKARAGANRNALGFLVAPIAPTTAPNNVNNVQNIEPNLMDVIDET
jgi:hypothetical protein